MQGHTDRQFKEEKMDNIVENFNIEIVIIQKEPNRNFGSENFNQ